MKFMLVIAFVLTLGTPLAWAGPFTDDMSKCLVKSTSEADKTLLIKWIFAAMAAHPDVKSLSSIPPEKGAQLNRDVGALVMRLLTKNCKSETKQAVDFEGEDTFKTSFGILGQVAMQGLMVNDEVLQYISGFESYLNTEELQHALGSSKNEPVLK